MTLWPNGSRTMPRVSSEWGARDPINTPNGSTTGSFHHGIDLIGWANNKSPANGVVTFAAYNGGGGNQINIRADNGDVFIIMHNARFLVSKGQRVAEGQDVGVMGTTGNSTGVHCHFECHPGGGADINPRDYMRAALATAGLDVTPIEEETPTERENRMSRPYLIQQSEVGTNGYGLIVLMLGLGLYRTVSAQERDAYEWKFGPALQCSSGHFALFLQDAEYERAFFLNNAASLNPQTIAAIAAAVDTDPTMPNLNLTDEQIAALADKIAAAVPTIVAPPSPDQIIDRLVQRAAE